MNRGRDAQDPQMLHPLAEAVIEPAQPIIDAHHHLYDREHLRYLLPEFIADLSSGHDIRTTVFVQAHSMYRTDGPARFRPVGETEFARKIASEAASDRRLNARLCDAIVGYADLMLGDAVHEVLDAHLEAGDGHFKGIRHIVAWDSDASLLNPAYPTFPGMLASDRFRAGFAKLGRLGLSFDAWLLFHQLDDLADLARDFPDTRIILNHCGGILGIGAYSGQSQDVFDVWRASIIELARRPNVWVKIGGFGMKPAGFQDQLDFARTPSRELARSWRPWAETCIEAFGAQRCMLESNFPADRTNLTYGKLWNAMKWLVADAGEEDKQDLFWRSAATAYRLEDVLADLSTKRSAVLQASRDRPVSGPGSAIGEAPVATSLHGRKVSDG